MLFQNREAAGQRLAKALADYKGRDCVVLALPRGGVPVAAPVAALLGAPLSLLLVRKIGAPDQPELAIGAVIGGGNPIIVRDAELIRRTGVTPGRFDELCAREIAEIERRRKFYSAPPEKLEGRIAVVIDDGLATGNTMRAALKGARLEKPKLLVMAVPLAPRQTMESLHGEADRVVCLSTPENFGSVGAFYDDFRQVTDKKVIRLLAQCRRASD